MPLWEIEYSAEVKNYFIDSGAYTGNLLGEIERLRYAPDGLPAEEKKGYSFTPPADAINVDKK
ncbi:MAG: hypothetical protein HC802_12915 [Caldilineaceae bacterium]|nr:hypothetical protein [Caldilineaceae bacterium]